MSGSPYQLGNRELTPRDYPEAVEVLKKNLRGFSFDGLTELEKDLENDAVNFGTWDGCVLSYRRGERGTTRRDCDGKARNAFTIFWDHGWIKREDVLDAVRQEILTRMENVPVETIHKIFSEE